MSVSNHQKSRLQYSIMLLKTARSTHEIYKRMLENHKSGASTSANSLVNSSTRRINNQIPRTGQITLKNRDNLNSYSSFSNLASINVPDERPKEIKNLQSLNANKNSNKRNCYKDYITLKNKSNYPFGLTEKRFKWQNLNDKSNPILPDDKKNKKHRLKINSYFNKGFSGFYGEKEPKVEHISPKRKRIARSVEGQVVPYNVYVYGLNSRRVVNPENNFEPTREERGKKKTFSSCVKIHFNCTQGNYGSLLDRTPMFIPVRGKRLYKNKSFQEDSLNLFTEDYPRFEVPKNIKGRVEEIRKISNYDHLNNSVTEHKTMEDLRKHLNKKNYQDFNKNRRNMINNINLNNLKNCHSIYKVDEVVEKNYVTNIRDYNIKNSDEGHKRTNNSMEVQGRRKERFRLVDNAKEKVINIPCNKQNHIIKDNLRFDDNKFGRQRRCKSVGLEMNELLF